jgi:hypothetical protein
MFNKNVFTQTDPVADLIRGINEADYKAKMEALKGDQHKIDKNKNNKIDAHDFKILRGEKKVNEEDLDEDSNVKIPTPTGTRVLGHRYGNAAKTHRDSLADPFAVVRGPGKKDMEALGKKMAKKEEIDPNVTTTDTLTGRVNGKSANPFLKAKVKLNVNEEDLEEAKFNPLKHIEKKNQTPAIVAAAKLVKPTSYGDRAAINKAGGVKDTRGPRGVTQEEAKKEDPPFDGPYKKPDTKPGHGDASRVKHLAKMAIPKMKKEEVEMNERSLSPAEKDAVEVNVMSMKKSLKGFKARYGKNAKSVMYATATKQAKKD